MSTSRGSGSRSGASSLRRQSQRHDEQDEEEDDDDDDDNGEHDEPLIVLSSASKRFIRAMREIHKACFVRGVYAATLQRLSVSIADMKMALDLCHEVPVEVDITHMLNVSTLGSRGVLGDSFVAPARDSVTAAFKTAIGKAYLFINTYSFRQYYKLVLHLLRKWTCPSENTHATTLCPRFQPAASRR